MNVNALTLLIALSLALWSAPTSAAALTINSQPTASPKSPAVMADTTFSAAATGTGALVYQWNFGDGTPTATGASVVHDFADVGTYGVTLTVTDSSGATVTASLSVIVTGTITSPKLNISLYFSRTAKDTIFLQGQLRVPANAKLAGQTFAVTVGGVAATFTLNELGQASSAPGNVVKVFVKTLAADADGWNAQFYLNLKGNFQTTLAANANLTNRDANREPVKVKLTATLLGTVYSGSITQEFDARKGIKGITR